MGSTVKKYAGALSRSSLGDGKNVFPGAYSAFARFGDAVTKRLRLFRRDEGGTVIVTSALAMSAIMLLVAASIDFAMMEQQKQKLQATADAAALAAVKEYSVATTDEPRFKEVVDSFVNSNLQGGKAGVGTKFTSNPARVTVTLEQATETFFLRDYAPSKVVVKATAQLMNGTPICVLGLENTSGTITLADNALLTGNRCAVYSNSTRSNGIEAKGAAVLSAELICTSGNYSGSESNFSQEPVTDCPALDDPLADRPAPSVGACTYTDLVIGDTKDNYGVTNKTLNEEIHDETVKTNEGTTDVSDAGESAGPVEYVTLKPGVYCGGLVVGGNTHVTLTEGTYIIKDGPLQVQDQATFEGEHVGFYLTGKKAILFLGPETTISLTAPTYGELAGLLFFEDRNQSKSRKFSILSDNARVLVGTIYVPNAYLYIDADKPIADKSAYTAIVAGTMSLYAGPHLVLNSDYDQTDVPVPVNIGGVHLSAKLTN